MPNRTCRIWISACSGSLPLAMTVWLFCSASAAAACAVATFIRSPAELAAVAAYQPFAPAELTQEGSSMYIAFLQAAPGDAAAQKLLTFRTEVDDFHVHNREFYWLRRIRMSDST